MKAQEQTKAILKGLAITYWSYKGNDLKHLFNRGIMARQNIRMIIDILDRSHLLK